MLKEKTLEEFLDDLASGEPTPGGGAAAAVVGAMSAALVSMVANVTLNSRDYTRVHGKAASTAERCTELREKFYKLADDDAAAFDGYMRAIRMPKTTRKESAARDEAICEAARRAATVPLETLELCVECGALAAEAAVRWSAAARSDAVEAALLAKAAAVSAAHNVHANMPYTKDDAFNREMENRLRRAIDSVSRFQDEAEGVRKQQ